MGVALHQEAVDERAGVALVAVADHVARPVGARPRRSLPLTGGREPGAAAAPKSRSEGLVEELPGTPRRACLRDDLPGVGALRGDPGEDHRRVDRGAEGDLGIARLCPAGELIDKVGTRVRCLAVERRGPAVAVPEAVDGLKGALSVVADAPRRCAELCREVDDVGAAAGGEASGARADLDVAGAARLEAEIGVEGDGGVDMCAREPELAGHLVRVFVGQSPCRSSYGIEAARAPPPLAARSGASISVTVCPGNSFPRVAGPSGRPNLYVCAGVDRGDRLIAA